MAERELLIWLKPTVAPGAAGAFKSVAEMAKKAHNATAESHSKTTRKMKDELSDYEKSVGKTFKQMEKEDLRRFKAQSQQIKQQAAEQKKAIAEVAREKAKAERDLQRGAQAEVNRQYKQQRMAEQARAKEERAEKQKEKAEERVGKLRLNAMAATLHLGEKLTQVGRGAALLSFMGKKEDMEHVVQGLEAIQGTFDVVSGGLGVLRAGQHAWHAWGAEARMAAKAAGVAKGGLGLAEGAEAIGGVGMAAPMVGKAGAAVASGGVGVGLAGAAAVAAAIFAGYSIYKTGQAISKHGVGGGYDEDTALGRYGNWAGGKLNAGKNWLTRMMGRTNNEIEAEDAEEHRRKQKENTNKYLEQYGPVIQAKREADAQRRQLALGGEQERLSMAYQGVYDPEKIKAKRGFSFAASAGLAEAKRNVIGTEEYYGAAHRSTAEARAGVETAENTHYGQGPEAEEEHLKGVLAAREELTRSIEEEKKAALDKSQAVIAAEKAEQDAIKEKLEQRKAGMMGFAMMSPEERAKSSIALQQVRAGGNMSDEMMQTAYKAAATPEEKRDIEAKMMQSHAAEYEKAHGMAAGSAMANEQYTTGTGGTRNVNVNTIHQLEIDMHADTETITHAVINVMTTLRREIQEQANKAINDKVQGAVSRSQITAPK